MSGEFYVIITNKIRCIATMLRGRSLRKWQFCHLTITPNFDILRWIETHAAFAAPNEITHFTLIEWSSAAHVSMRLQHSTVMLIDTIANRQILIYIFFLLIFCNRTKAMRRGLTRRQSVARLFASGPKAKTPTVVITNNS